MIFTRPKASPPIDGQLGHPLLHMQLETQFWGVRILVSSYCWSSYRVADPFSSLGNFPSFFIGGPVFHLIDGCEYPLLCLPGTGIASQEIAISGPFQQNLAGVCNSVYVWWLIMGWIPGWDSLWMVHPFISAPNLMNLWNSFGILWGYWWSIKPSAHLYCLKLLEQADLRFLIVLWTFLFLKLCRALSSF
jgi:hypothetical protein